MILTVEKRSIRVHLYHVDGSGIEPGPSRWVKIRESSAGSYCLHMKLDCRDIWFLRNVIKFVSYTTPLCTTRHYSSQSLPSVFQIYFRNINPLKPELNPVCYLLALLGAYHFLHVSRIRVKLLTFRRLMSYIYGAPILDVSRSHTTTQHSW